MKIYRPRDNLYFGMLALLPGALLAGLFVLHPSRELALIAGATLVLLFLFGFFGSRLLDFVVTDDGMFGYREGISRLFRRRYIAISRITELRATNENTNEEISRMPRVKPFLRVHYTDQTGKQHQQDAILIHLRHFSGPVLKDLFENIQTINPTIYISRGLWNLASREEQPRSVVISIALGGFGGIVLGMVIGVAFDQLALGAQIGGITGILLGGAVGFLLKMRHATPHQ